MVTAILVAIIGNKVFPDMTGWWITYCIFAVIVMVFKAAWEQIKN